MPVVKEIPDPLTEPLGSTGQGFLLGSRGAASGELGDLAVQFLAQLAQSPQDRRVDLFDDVEPADLMAGLRENLVDDVGIQGRSVRGNAGHGQAAGAQHGRHPGEEPPDIDLGWGMVQDLKGQAALEMGVHREEHAEGPS